MQTWKNVAYITGTKSLNGGLVTRSVSGLSFLPDIGMKVWFVPPVLDMPREGTIIDKTDDDVFGATLFVDTVSDIDIASKLIGCNILISAEDAQRASFGDEDKYIGYDVVDKTYGNLGKVIGVKTMPAQLLLVVRGQTGKELLIPMVPEIITSTDEMRTRMHTDIPKGLMSL
ncbi:MAG: hypothetical protein J6Y65_04490 [Eggerthellaceae bacterium]|nr:hypothetical protein [Eggerthellaceae bacterium]